MVDAHLLAVVDAQQVVLVHVVVYALTGVPVLAELHAVELV